MNMKVFELEYKGNCGDVRSLQEYKLVLNKVIYFLMILGIRVRTCAIFDIRNIRIEDGTKMRS